jgi:hypothetical protein
MEERPREELIVLIHEMAKKISKLEAEITRFSNRLVTSLWPHTEGECPGLIKKSPRSRWNEGYCDAMYSFYYAC